MPASRIVSLLPAATEMVAALGAADRLVGRSHECDYPESVLKLPAVTSTRIPSASASETIHRAVTEAVAANEPLFRIDSEALAALAPDLILTQDHCAVCAVSRSELDDIVKSLPVPRPEVLALAPNRFADLWSDLRRLGIALGLPDEGRSAVALLKQRVVDVIQRMAGIEARPTVACLEWLDPLMGSGNWIPEMIELAGGTSLLGQAGRHSQWVTFDQLRAADPDVLVVLPCGFGLSRVCAALEPLVGQSPWTELRAVREGRVFAADGNAYFNRPGPRLVDSLEILAEIVHPQLYPHPSHQSTGWRPFSGSGRLVGREVGVAFGGERKPD
jgi:iron complex transport system substrate-binding protein